MGLSLHQSVESVKQKCVVLIERIEKITGLFIDNISAEVGFKFWQAYRTNNGVALVWVKCELEKILENVKVQHEIN